jgi:hypothetical protein
VSTAQAGQDRANHENEAEAIQAPSAGEQRGGHHVATEDGPEGLLEADVDRQMRAMISRVANLRVRSVGTLGGNLCFADPHSCPADGFTARAGACAEQAAAGCAPLPDGEASPDYLRHLVAVHARQALREAFASAT